jgi:hypothetical protein
MGRDFVEELFKEMSRRAPEQLRDLVGHWANRWQECNTIPLLGQHRRRRTELRALAWKAIRRLVDPEMHPTQRT